MAEEKQDAAKLSLWEHVLAKRAQWAKEQPALECAEIKALAREAAKDIHNTLQLVFFGTPAGPGEPGTPLVPTQAMVTSDLGTLESMGMYQNMLDGYSTAGPTAQLHDKGRER